MGMDRGESARAEVDNLPMEKGVKTDGHDEGLDKNELFEKMLEVRDQANARKRE